MSDYESALLETWQRKPDAIPVLLSDNLWKEREIAALREQLATTASDGNQTSSLTAEVERLTRERDNARAWSARWKAVAKRIWTGVHHPLDMCEFDARRREAAEAERDALAATVAALREAGEALAEYVEHQPFSLARLAAIEAWRAALAAASEGE